MFRIVEDNFDDILFEKRQKRFGAYYLRKNYSKYVVIGGLTSFVSVTLFLLIWWWIVYIQPPKKNIDIDQDLFFKEFDSSLPPLPLDKLTPRLNKAGAPKPEQEKVLEVVKDELVKEKELKDNTVKTDVKVLADTSSKEGNDKNGKDTVISKGISDKGDTSKTALVVEPIGGISEFILYVQKNVKYPELAKRNNISGTIYVYFIVNEEGKIEDIKITKPLGFGINEEVMRVISSAPGWKPLKVNGIAQKQRIHVPIKLNLPK